MSDDHVMLMVDALTELPRDVPLLRFKGGVADGSLAGWTDPDVWPPPDEMLFAVGKVFGMSSWTTAKLVEENVGWQALHSACNVFLYHRETFWTVGGEHRSNEAGAAYEFGRQVLP